MKVLQSPAVLACLLLFAASTTMGAAHAAPGEHTQAYGSMAGDPRVLEDGKVCFDAVAAAGAEGTQCSVLYGHIFDLLNAVPANVQRPHDAAEDLATSFWGAPGYEPLWDFNDLTLYSSPGFVEYPNDPSGDPRIHPERGITDDVRLDTHIPIVGYWYLSADADEVYGIDEVPDGSGGPNTGIAPCLTVRMVLETGRFPGQGTQLAAGEVTKTIVSQGGAGPDDGSRAEPVTQVECPGAGPADIMAPDDVTEFEVTLQPLGDELVIPADEAFLVFVEWYQFSPGDPDEQDKVYQNQINVRTGPEHLARVVVPVMDAVRIERVTPVAFDGKTFIQVVANSPWGSYDVDPGSIAITIRTADGTAVPVDHLALERLHYSVDHGSHFKPVTAIFAWDHEADALPAGTYTIEASAKNWQHTGTATNRGTITILPGNGVETTDQDGVVTATTPGAGENERTPGPAIGLLVMGVTGAAAVIRRWGPNPTAAQR